MVRQRGDHVEIDLEAGEGKETERHRHIVRERQQSPDAKLPFEPEPDVDRDSEHCEDDRLGALARQLLADLARDGFAGIDPGAGKLLGDRRPQFRNHLVGGSFGPGRAREPDLIGPVVAERLDARFADAQPPDARPQIFDVHRLGELGAHDLAADEIDPEVQAAVGGVGERQDREQRRQNDREVAPPHEVDVRMVGDELQELH